MMVPVDPTLKRLISEAAAAESIPMNEWLARLASVALGRPELGKIPRGNNGRPRRVQVAV